MDNSERQNLHDTAALRALAEGEVLNTDVPPHDDEQPGDTAAGAELDMIAPAAADAAKVPNKVRAENFSNRQLKSTAVQFRRTAIPLLYVLGVILWVIGGLTLGKVAGAEPGEFEGNPLLENGILFSAVSIILGVLLIAGGVYFHYEIRKSEKLDSQR